MNFKGKIGELIGRRYLESKKYHILARNYRSRYGEIDVVCQRESTVIVFCEIKHYKKNSMVSSLMYINNYQKKKILHTANLYIQEFQDSHNVKDISYRFDILLIEDGYVKQHIENVNYF